jgi:acetylornithine deacetylase/succinyl-diaminopimelate desuccinylase-like protein
MSNHGMLLPTILMVLAVTRAVAASTDSADTASNEFARQLLEQLIAINTTDSVGNVTQAAELAAKELKAHGFAAADMRILGPNERKKNLVVRLKGSGQKKPLLIIGHLDVVEAPREQWSSDPFKLVEKDGYFYGRGTLDMKSADAVALATLIRLKHEGYRGSRDIILALTADEEGGCCNGVAWLLKNERALVDAEFALNLDEDASLLTVNHKPWMYRLIASEKTYGDYLLTAINPGGHSSLPVPDNAIYELNHALTRLERYQFPFELNGITRQYYEARTRLESGRRAADMQAILRDPPDQAAIARLSRDKIDNATMRTTCVATRFSAGQENSALPQRAQANINCRVLPGHSLAEVQHKLIEVIHDPAISVQYVADDGAVLDWAPERRGFTPGPVPGEILDPLRRLVGQFWPGISVVPSMEPGASDSIYAVAAGIPAFLITGFANDVANLRAHAVDERMLVDSFDRGNEFFYRYLKELTTP